MDSPNVKNAQKACGILCKTENQKNFLPSLTVLII